ncbi:Uncharacterised protein [Citrobacter freundii]|nr:Uncharacterised protein [Citrobacter freundii]
MKVEHFYLSLKLSQYGTKSNLIGCFVVYARFLILKKRL